MSSKKLRKRKGRLVSEHPFCFWCGIEVKVRRLVRGGNNDNIATIDHLDSAYCPLPHISAPDGGRTVLSCRKCNNERNDAEQRNLPIEIKWSKSKRYPRKKKL